MAELVRDNVPSMIKAEGLTCATERLSDAEFKINLKKNLVNKANEISTSDVKCLYEKLADLYEIADTLVEIYNLEDAVATEKELKGISKGRYRNKTLLKSVL